MWSSAFGKARRNDLDTVALWVSGFMGCSGDI
jgi:hypothetical protein